MIQVAEVFPDQAIVQTLSAQLAWSHFLEIIYLKDSLQRYFYIEMCRVERWSALGYFVALAIYDARNRNSSKIS
jgi:DUF1016 N-terminal domain